METVCKLNECTGCSACVDKCPKGAITIVDSIHALNAEINNKLCIHCNLCYKTCPNINKVELKEQLMWKQGWAVNPEIRAKSSSGGLAAAISRHFIKNGGIVWSCEFGKGNFIFSYAENIEELTKFRGSKYVKSSPAGSYRQIETQLKEGKKILFIGLPCQVAGLKNFINEQFHKNLYTIDLICHGTPSQRILKNYLENDLKLPIENLSNLNFRIKTQFMLCEEEKTLLPNKSIDRYTMAFMNGLDYTHNCYSCRYAHQKRVSDITLGDSWGTTLPDEQKGISLILCQTAKGKELLESEDIYLTDVDINRALKFNHQLNYPTRYTETTDKFFKFYLKNYNLKKTVFQIYPKWCIKEDLKKYLFKLS